MGEVEEVQEQMKTDTEALKEKMATMMEAMMRERKRTWVVVVVVHIPV